jgi:hypothetical protein
VQEFTGRTAFDKSANSAALAQVKTWNTPTGLREP